MVSVCCCSQRDSVRSNEARLPAISAAQPYLPERAGWTQGQGREVIRQGVVVNDGPPCTPGLQPPAAPCAFRPAQKAWWGGSLTFRPGTCFWGCPQKNPLSHWRFSSPVRISHTPLQHRQMHTLLLNFQSLPTPKLLEVNLWTEEWIQISHHNFASTAAEVFPAPLSFFFFVTSPRSPNFHPPNLSSAFLSQQAKLANSNVNFLSLTVCKVQYDADRE